MAGMNVDKLTLIAQKSELARAVFKTLAEMGKSRPTTDLGRFKARVSEVWGRNINQRELLDVFKELQTAGVGKLVLSRDITKAPHRFEWAFNNIEVGRAAHSRVASGLAAFAQRGTAALAPSPSAQGGSVAAGAPEGAVMLCYPIRGQLYPFHLPADLSRAEAQGLCEFISRFAR